MDDFDGVNAFLDSLEIPGPGEEFIADPAWRQKALTPSQHGRQLRRIKQIGEIIDNWRRCERGTRVDSAASMNRELGR